MNQMRYGLSVTNKLNEGTYDNIISFEFVLLPSPSRHESFSVVECPIGIDIVSEDRGLSSTTKPLYTPKSSKDTSFSNNKNTNTNVPKMMPKINHLLDPLSLPLVPLDVPSNLTASPRFCSHKMRVTRSLGGL